ncbi:MAG: hypothetical protein QOH21_3855 [Acidobacteriota bacterium]|jgi:hypothetical protein|nr:hypothetical protein [Acidobacteriota bacterium]
MRNLAVILLLTLAVAATAAPAKKKASPPAPAVVAPETLAHPMALFLSSLSQDGKRQVTYRASAFGTHFFLEEPSGVTVYRFKKGQYVREEFLKGAKLAAALKKYAKK